MRLWSRVCHHEGVEVRGQSVLLPCRFLELNPGHQAWWQALNRCVSFSWMQGLPHRNVGRLQAMGMQWRGRRELCRMPRFLSWIFPSPAWLERRWRGPEGRGGEWKPIPHPKLLAILYLECVFTPGGASRLPPPSLTPWGSEQLEWTVFHQMPLHKTISQEMEHSVEPADCIFHQQWALWGTGTIFKWFSSCFPPSLSFKETYHCCAGAPSPLAIRIGNGNRPCLFNTHV